MPRSRSPRVISFIYRLWFHLVYRVSTFLLFSTIQSCLRLLRPTHRAVSSYVCCVSLCVCSVLSFRVFVFSRVVSYVPCRVVPVCFVGVYPSLI
jgi:hypothetical protein